ncbi:hypothetical protein D3C78_1352160 [compost metagenome]
MLASLRVAETTVACMFNVPGCWSLSSAQVWTLTEPSSGISKESLVRVMRWSFFSRDKCG